MERHKEDEDDMEVQQFDTGLVWGIWVVLAKETKQVVCEAESGECIYIYKIQKWYDGVSNILDLEGKLGEIWEYYVLLQTSAIDFPVA